MKRFNLPTPQEWRELREKSKLRPTDIIDAAGRNIMKAVYRLEEGENVSIWTAKEILDIYKKKKKIK